MKIGSKTCPATDEDIQSVGDELKKAFDEAREDESKLIVMVTHHDFEVQAFEIPDAISVKVNHKLLFNRCESRD